MRMVLGIDTGGTYTDGVIIESGSEKILRKAKARTTRDDLTIGIKECIDNLQFEQFDQISLVALSTTLATNAIVEGQGCEVGVIMIGGEPLDKLPVAHYAVIGGGHDPGGLPYKPLDEERLLQALAGFAGKVAAIAISGFCSVRNPEHELRAKEIVKMQLKVPVVCAHELTTTLGFYQRTVTAALNARLLPVITEWLDVIEQALTGRGIKAPLMIVRSDGSLMTAAAAREKPVETILTGPAASTVGACTLSGQNDAVILDMGGTTTDIALITNGSPKLNPEGAVVGGWHTRVKAAEIYTYGLGGDSYIQVESKKLAIGPERVLPLCYAACRYPHLIEELSSAKLTAEIFAPYQKTDCLMLVKNSNEQAGWPLSPEEQELISVIQDQPHSIYYIARRLESAPSYVNRTATSLIKRSLVTRIALTPTDILHVLQAYTLWSCTAAELGVSLLANQLSVHPEEFIARAVDQITDDLAVAILQSLIKMQGHSFNIKENRHNIFVQRALDTRANDYFTCNIRISAPVVAIGAPVQAWLPQVGARLNMELHIPEHAEVANAFGAAAAKLLERVEVVIKPVPYGNGFSVHLPWEYKTFATLETAVAYATHSARERVCSHLLAAGSDNPEIRIERKDIVAACNQGDEFFVETILRVIGAGEPKLA